MNVFRQVAFVEDEVLEKGIRWKWRGEEGGGEEFSWVGNCGGGGFREGELGGGRRKLIGVCGGEEEEEG